MKMNRRIRKKKQKLAAMHASKYKYAKLGKKRAHAVYIQSRHCMWGLIPGKDNYAMYLLRKRRCGKLESKIIQHVLSSKSLIMNCLSERKEVKKKLFVKEGNCDFERKPLPDEFVRGRIWNE
jgi:hypothetical protein